MSEGLDIPINIDRDSDVSLREQLVVKLRAAIRDGLLPVGYPMPSSRVLAAQLGLSRSTIVAVYLELEGEGWLEVTQGSGTFVSERYEPPSAPTGVAKAPAVRHDQQLDLRPGDLDPTLVSLPTWRSSFRKVTPSSAPPPAAGIPQLRTSFASYLGAARGLQCDPSEIILCAGTAEALTVLGLALQWAGKRIAVEDPGYPAVRAALHRLGARWVPVDARDPKTLVSKLYGLAEPVAALYITPSHQYPLGHRLDGEVRRELLGWAAATGSVIIEDDYDAEFRFGVPPLPSLAGLDRNADVVFLGTMSKVLDPGLRLTYLRVPQRLLGVVASTREDLGATVSTPIQQVATELISGGHLTRHIARVRKIYADRRRVLLDGLNAIPAVQQIRGIDAGLHVVAELSAGYVAGDIAQRARARGVLIADLDEYRATPSPASPALVLGYGKVNPAQIRAATRLLSEICSQD